MATVETFVAPEASASARWWSATVDFCRRRPLGALGAALLDVSAHPGLLLLGHHGPQPRGGVEARTDLRLAGGVRQRGSVAVVADSPPDNRYAYTLRFADGQTVKAYFRELAIRRKEVEDQLALTGADLRPYVVYRCRVGSRAFGLATDDSDDDLDETRRMGFTALTADELRAAKATPLGVLPQPNELPRGCIAAGDRAFFCDYAMDYLARAGISKDQVARGGYLIRTTLDPKMQSSIKSAIDRIASPTLDGVASVMSVIQPGKDAHRQGGWPRPR